MCGIAGFCDFKSSTSHAQLESTVSRMAEQLFHRGPDDAGTWADEISGIALGHRRLSVIDLTSEGHQPKYSRCGRYVIVFNGEIYNFQELRHELEKAGATFSGQSDTEVLLAACVLWGLETALQRFVGMFAFALWDRQSRTLFLARDRMGEKPLYYTWMGGFFLFASELKALRVHPAWQGIVDPESSALMLQYGNIPAPRSIYKSVYKLLPGHFLSINLSNSSEHNPKPYWSLKQVAERGLAQPFQGSEIEAREQLDKVLRAAVRGQMISDVPLGAFLSGGIDSACIVALMQTQSSRPVKTFTIGFHDERFDEASRARAVAQHLKTEHTELYATEIDALELIPRLPILFDEPFGDSSQIPTYLVAKLTRQHVTVALSGDGGDELFAGYNRHLQIEKLWRLRSLPFSKILAKILSFIPPKFLAAFLSDTRTDGTAKVLKLMQILSANSEENALNAILSQWPNSEADPLVSQVSATPVTRLLDRQLWLNHTSPREQMQYLDALVYLPDDILVKVDRACMAVSLESRAPFLDHRVVEFAWTLPAAFKVKSGLGKHLLREVLYQYVPAALFSAEKMGFAVPLNQWLKGPLREWADELLDEKKLTQSGLNGRLIAKLWREHLSGTCDRQHLLWNVLMLQAWRTAVHSA